MLSIDDAIILNKYGQGLLETKNILDSFSTFYLIKKREYLIELIALIAQSKPVDRDIEKAIVESKLKSTYTPCVLLRKGFANHDLKKIADLPENELNKALLLFLGLFKVAYQRRFEMEKNNLDKWWYWDLSIESNVEKIKTNFG